MNKIAGTAERTEAICPNENSERHIRWKSVCISTHSSFSPFGWRTPWNGRHQMKIEIGNEQSEECRTSMLYGMHLSHAPVRWWGNEIHAAVGAFFCTFHGAIHAIFTVANGRRACIVCECEPKSPVLCVCTHSRAQKQKKNKKLGRCTEPIPAVMETAEEKIRRTR